MKGTIILVIVTLFVSKGKCRIRVRPPKAAYSYSFDVADDSSQLYQSHSQKLADQNKYKSVGAKATEVVTGEYSWVDSIGIRRTVRYRADETGYHVLEMREEKRNPRRLKNRVSIKDYYPSGPIVRKKKRKNLDKRKSFARVEKPARRSKVLRVVKRRKKKQPPVRSFNDFNSSPAKPLPINVLPLSILEPVPPLLITSAPSLSII